MLQSAKIPSMVTLFRQRRIRWLGNVCGMDVGRILKDWLYSNMPVKRQNGQPHLRFKDVCKLDMKALDIDVNTWEDLALYRPSWRHTLITAFKDGEDKLRSLTDKKRTQRKQ